MRRKQREELMKVYFIEQLMRNVERKKLMYNSFHEQKFSGTSKDNRSQVINETLTDESNDVVFVETPGPKSFKNLFDREQLKSETKKAAKDATDETPDQDKNTQHKAISTKSKNEGNGNATKRTDWDMFAEQDIDSNFDVNQKFIKLFSESFSNRASLI